MEDENENVKTITYEVQIDYRADDDDPAPMEGDVITSLSIALNMDGFDVLDINATRI